MTRWQPGFNGFGPRKLNNPRNEGHPLPQPLPNPEPEPTFTAEPTPTTPQRTQTMMNRHNMTTQQRIALGIVTAAIILIVLAVSLAGQKKPSTTSTDSYTPSYQPTQSYTPAPYVPQKPATQTVCTQDYTPYGIPVANGVHCEAVPVFGG